MIIGIGSDLTDIRRIQAALARFGDRFIARCFTETERQKAQQRGHEGQRAATYAKRFAAKEAVSKALGTGFSQGVFLQDIGVANDENGRPAVRLTGGALKRLREITPEGREAVIHLSLSDEPPLAKAVAIIEAL